MKIKQTDWLVIISSLGCFGWTVTIFLGGMIIFLLLYWYLIIPLIITYFLAIRSIIWTDNKFRVYWLILLSLPWIVMASGTIYFSELVQGEIVLSGTKYEDNFHYTLNFRDEGKCDMYIVGMLGYTERIYGKYTYSNDRIFFLKKPYSNDRFLSDSMFIDKENDLIYVCNTSGNPCSENGGRRDEFMIDKIKL